MKKTKFMRAALLLLVLTLITSCFVGGTFAKYTTSASSSDFARVAKWGFNYSASVDLTDLFKNAYTNEANGETVKSADTKVDVIAPGTNNSQQFAFKYDTTNNGATRPEVAYNFTVDAEASGSYAALDANPSFKWTLKNGDGSVEEYSTVAKLLEAIKALSGDASGTKQYEAGYLPEGFTADGGTYIVGWRWDFVATSTGVLTPEQIDAQDANDTGMGNANPLDNVTLKITITATQID